MTRDEFQAWFAGPDTTWGQLAAWLVAEPCDCGEEFCRGWATRAKPNGGNSEQREERGR